MDCEERLVTQVELAAAASPGQRFWVYRNAIKALPYYTSVRKILESPAHAPWFLSFDPGLNKTHQPRCDPLYSPPLCSKLYHDQSQGPNYPTG